MNRLAQADLLVELSWEVCNKVGGINTVLASKAVLMQQYYPHYVCVGPYVPSKAAYEFFEETPPHEYTGVFSYLRDNGIIAHYGHWRIKGEPKAILLDFLSDHVKAQKDSLKGLLWEHYGVDSLNSAWDFDEPVLWSKACSLLIEGLVNGPYQGKQVVSHHHEWMAGISLLFIKEQQLPVATVFTTHATMLGRALAGSGQDLYSTIDHLDPEKKAREIGVMEKFSTERACAQNADAFTTVSEITGYEAEKFFNKKPDVLTLNGLDIARFPTIEENSIKHVTSRTKLREYITYHFYPYYRNFDLENNLMLCISGRFEYGNKGVDVLVEALGRLNERLRKQGSKRTITVFFWLMGLGTGIRGEMLENKNYYYHIKNYVEWHSKSIIQKVITHFIASDDPASQSSYSKEFMEKMKTEVLHFRRQGNPPLSSFHLYDEHNNPLIRDLLRVGLDNQEDDPVKVVVYPVFLEGNDGLINLSYFDALAGCHLAVFPSYYEPWGYTPLEAAALGVPTITTDAAGFGRFVKQQLSPKHPGVFVIDRCGKSYESVVHQLEEAMAHYISLPHAERVQNKVHAKQVSELADWAVFIKYYLEAHNLALKKAGFS